MPQLLSRLRKDAEQFDIFGNLQPVGLTPKAKARSRLREKQAQQLTLFGEPEPAVKPKGAAGARGRRARKGGEFIAGKRYEGGQWIPKVAFEAQAAGQSYQGKPAAASSGLSILRDEPVPALKPKPTGDRAAAQEVVPVDEPAAAVLTPVSTLKDKPTLRPVQGSETSATLIAVQPVAATDSEPPLGVDIDAVTTKQQNQRLKINRQVKQLLKDNPKGPYSEAELTLLSKYSGKGGITADEGSLSEYYTRPDVARFALDQLYAHGFTGGTVLEPSCGNGVFLQALKGDTQTLPVGVELDNTSGAAAKALNPHAEVTHGIPFERFLLDNPDFVPDAIAGNVPFGTRTVEDLEAFRKVGRGWKDNGDFFVHESLARLKPGGVLSLIVPHGITTGSAHQRLREELMKQGRVIGAYRLPSTAFEHTGTKTITDILVLQKHPDAVLNAILDGDLAIAAAVRDDDFIQGRYFDVNPANILGTVRAIKNQFGGDSFTVDGNIKAALKQAQPLAPSITYDGLDVSQAQQGGAKEGDTRYINGQLYQLTGSPLRWHRVDESEGATSKASDSSAYGVESMADAEAQLQDIGQRVLIHPDHLAAYQRLATDILPRADAVYLAEAAIAVGGQGSTADKAKLAQAMILAGHLKLLQTQGVDDPIQLEQALGLLQQYRDLNGNPATDNYLSGLVGQYPQLLNLQGAFDESGKISDFFANHAVVAEQVQRSHSDVTLAMLEAFRAAGGEPVGLDAIQEHLDSALNDSDLAAALFADPTVGYLGGTYQPMDRLLVGNGFALQDAMLMEAESLPEGSPLRDKLESQVSTISARLQPRALEDMTTPFWAVGSWIPATALNDFMKDRGYDLEVAYDNSKSQWQAQGNNPYGISEDVLTTLNRGRISHGTNTKDAKAAIAALEDDFKNWLSGSSYRLEVEDAYNLAFNGDLPQTFSGEPLEIAKFDQHDGIDGGRPKRLHDYQVSTIRQLVEQGRGINALGVGLGKTATSIAMALHLKELGRAKKPTFVVPKSVLSNWVREIDFWAPTANVMILGQTQQFWASGEPAWEVPGHKVKTKAGNPMRDKDGNYILIDNATKGQVTMTPEAVKATSSLAFKDDDRATKERKMRQLSQNDYDIVLMSEPVFQDISLHPDKESEYLNELAQNDSHLNPDSANTRKEKERLETARRRIAERTGEKTKNITFEELGIDCLIHDEAHHVKNLFGTKRTGDVAFLSQAQSNRALDFYYKSRYIRETNNNQNTYLLTATPTTNNPLEAANMLQHVCPDEFDKRGIQNVDDFLSLFGKIETITVPGVDLEMTEKNGLVGFKNLKDLRHLFSKYCRMQSAKDVGLPIPEEQTQDHFVEMTTAQKELYQDLKIRAQKVADDDNDHIFSVISDMDKAAIDLNYYNVSNSGFSEVVNIPDGEQSPKIAACSSNVMSSRSANGGKQIVFCDAVQLHDSLKAQLVAAGYPESEIAIVNAKTMPKSSDRQKVSQAYNDGRITLVIGNTATMGEGMNFQIGTTDIHHLTTPWTPAAIEQRNGRGVRQGNTLDGVGCHYYHAKGSFDSYRKGVIERKRGWIDDLWHGDSDEAVNVNTGGLTMDEINIMMSDDPEAARQQLEANRELQMARHKEKMGKAALKQFGQFQTMKLALSKMTPEAKNSQRGRALESRLRAATDALARNDYFPHKDLLSGDKPAYIGTDGTVIRVGDHIEKRNGRTYRVTGIDQDASKFITQMVSGASDRPSAIEAGDITHDFKTINSGAYYGLKPTNFDDSIHAERVINSIRDYSQIATLSPDAINANRDRILDQLKDSAPYALVPYVDAAGGVAKGRLDQLPNDARMLWPHDGDAIEAVLRTMARPDAKAEWQYHGILEGLTGSTWYEGKLKDRFMPKVEQYRAEHAALSEPAPKGGDVPAAPSGNAPAAPAGPAATPDPIAAIKEGFMTLLGSDPDGASEQNGVGFNGHHTPYRYFGGQHYTNNEFVAGMIERFQDGNALAPNQLKASLNVLSTYQRQLAANGVDLPSTEDLEAAIKGMPAPAVAASLKQTRHAKRGIDLHVVALDARVDGDTYQRLNSQAKRLGGYYSRYDRQGAIPGFQFEDRESAEKMMDYAYTLNKAAQPFTLSGILYDLKRVGSGLRLVKLPNIKARLVHV